MDLQVISTMGLTDEDVEAIEKLDGIEKAEAGYSVDALCTEGDNQIVMHVMSLLPSMNQVRWRMEDCLRSQTNVWWMQIFSQKAP